MKKEIKKKRQLKIAVVGSREFINLKKVVSFVNSLPSNYIVVSGGAVGVDLTAQTVAVKRNMGVKQFKPKWKVNGIYNPKAGFERNKEIISFSDFVVAFWNGESNGTLDSIKHAIRFGKKVMIFPDVME